MHGEICSVCTEWNRYASGDILWRELYFKRFHTVEKVQPPPSEESKRLQRSRRHKQMTSLELERKKVWDSFDFDNASETETPSLSASLTCSWNMNESRLLRRENYDRMVQYKSECNKKPLRFDLPSLSEEKEKPFRNEESSNFINNFTGRKKTKTDERVEESNIKNNYRAIVERSVGYFFFNDAEKQVCAKNSSSCMSRNDNKTKFSGGVSPSLCSSYARKLASGVLSDTSLLLRHCDYQIDNSFFSEMAEIKVNCSGQEFRRYQDGYKDKIPFGACVSLKPERELITGHTYKDRYCIDEHRSAHFFCTEEQPKKDKSMLRGLQASFIEGLTLKESSNGPPTRKFRLGDISYMGDEVAKFRLVGKANLMLYKSVYYRRLLDPWIGDKVEVAWKGKFRLEAMDVYQGKNHLCGILCLVTCTNNSKSFMYCSA